jgi:hypothetical protein
MPKQMYHSEAVKNSPIHCVVKSDPIKSKYPHKETGEPQFYVELVIDSQIRTYTCENDACKKAVTGLKGRQVILEFLGSRDDASIRNCGQGAAADDPEPQPAAPPPGFGEQQQRQRSDSPRKPQDAAANEADDLKKARATVIRYANLVGMALGAAEHLVAQHQLAHPATKFTSDNICSLAATLAIGADRAGAANLLPSHLIEKKPAQKPI